MRGNTTKGLRMGKGEGEAPPVIAKHRYARDTYKVTGAKQSSAGGTTYGVSQATTSTLDCFAAYHRYVSQVRWRLRKDGAPGRRTTDRATPCPVPAQCAGTVDGVTSAHGAGRAGLKPAPTLRGASSATNVQALVSDI
ncbi:MAG: hypothetical protein LBM98_09065 [Oscillospiraceae bacterium]|nr:hypothetical protein [Oscillospiraceae bacterium]